MIGADLLSDNVSAWSTFRRWKSCFFLWASGGSGSAQKREPTHLLTGRYLRKPQLWFDYSRERGSQRTIQGLSDCLLEETLSRNYYKKENVNSTFFAGTFYEWKKQAITNLKRWIVDGSSVNDASRWRLLWLSGWWWLLYLRCLRAT